jgi:hypothetical protein
VSVDPARSDDPAYLIPLTPEARRAALAPALPLRTLPFRVGRDRRDPSRTPVWPHRDRRRGGGPGPNDLYLPEPGPQYRLSREHFLIGAEGDAYFLEDRGSACGTLVEGRAVGGARTGGRCALREGDVIIPGGSGSRFAFKFTYHPPPVDTDEGSPRISS